MTNSQASLGLVFAALASTVGAVAGGVVANRAWTTNPRAVLLTPAVCALLACPALYLGASTHSPRLAIALYALSGGLSLVHAAPAAAAMQGMIPDRMRGFLSSLIASLLSLIGLGGGPFLAGALSDWFGSATNPASLGRALASISVLYVWAALHFALAARTLKRDLALNASEA
jgi:MFS family permease